MDTAFPANLGHPSHPHPNTSFMGYIALLAILLAASIPVGFMLLFISLYLDDLIQKKEGRNTRDRDKGKNMAIGEKWSLNAI
ncbi:hypothetical protein PG999_000400 [Apiospora kogelbergensis]|uniref:Uncharacterized protein n=1 Tax=Apiospora kogelbergensis TaxID=1337665 RepID=A0AAW0RBC5_9PEZI